MKDDYKVRQCHLERPEGDSVVHYTAWIPSTKAQIGKTIKIKDRGQWKVIHAGTERDSKEIVVDRDDYKRHRRATDI